MEKMTKIQALQLAVEKVYSLGDPENSKLVEKLESMLAQETKIVQNKKKNKKPSKIARDKEENAQKVIAFIEQSDGSQAYTLSDIAVAIGLENATPQKVAPIMKRVQELYELKVTKSQDKKVAYQKIVAE